MGDPTDRDPVPHAVGDLADPPSGDITAQRTDPGATGAEPGGHPGDQAEPGTPGTGENVCRVCRGTGRIEGEPCENCGGTGKVIEEIGGA